MHIHTYTHSHTLIPTFIHIHIHTYIDQPRRNPGLWSCHGHDAWRCAKHAWGGADDGRRPHDGWAYACWWLAEILWTWSCVERQVCVCVCMYVCMYVCLGVSTSCFGWPMMCGHMRRYFCVRVTRGCLCGPLYTSWNMHTYILSYTHAGSWLLARTRIH